MRWWWCASEVQVLNDPVDPLAFVGKLDQVLSAREAVVAIHDVLKDGLAPVDIHGGSVDTPNDDVAISVGVWVTWDGLDTLGDAWNTETDGESLNLSEEVGDVTDLVGHPGGERSRGVTVAAVGVVGLGGRSGNLLARVGHDSVTNTIVGGVAASSLGLDTEPVVTGSCVGVENDFVSLTNVEQDRVDVDGLDGDEVGGDDFKLVTINGNTEGVVNGHVDETEEMLLARSNLEVEVLARGTGNVHVGTVDEDVVGRRSVCWRGLVETFEGGNVGVLSRNVEPILESQWSQVNVPVVRGRTVNDDGAKETLTVLSSVVRVVP